jgi:hypothetical protein
MNLNNANITKTAFWDVDVSKIDMERDSLFVMEKVFNYGLWADIKSVLAYYGIDRIKKEITQARYLKKTALSFLCLVTGLREQDFSTITRRKARKGIVWDN